MNMLAAGAARMPTEQQSAPPTLTLEALLDSVQTESGRTLSALLHTRPILLVFLRHFGCTFCRQALEDISAIQPQLSAHGVQPVFVHLGSPERARPYFDYFGLTHVERISNPDASLYAHPAFALGRSNPFSHFFRPSVLKSWIGGSLRRHGIGMLQEDGFQMPGVFLLRDHAIAAAYRHTSIADRPDYLALADRGTGRSMQPA